MSRDLAEIVNFNARNRDRWVAGLAAGVPAGARVLDVGAGRCAYRRLFAHCEYYAQDFCRYRGRPGDNGAGDDWTYGPIDFVSDITAIPVADASFDVVLCTEVLEHVPEPLAALAELNRVLRPGGRLFLSAPLGAGLHQQPYHFYGGYTPHFYRRFLPACGFAVESLTPNGGFYRHLLQELHRAAGLIQRQRRYSWLHPAYWLLRLGFARALPRWLARLDDEHPIEDFTVGYHLTARKVGACPARPVAAGAPGAVGASDTDCTPAVAADQAGGPLR